MGDRLFRSGRARNHLMNSPKTCEQPDLACPRPAPAIYRWERSAERSQALNICPVCRCLSVEGQWKILRLLPEMPANSLLLGEAKSTMPPLPPSSPGTGSSPGNSDWSCVV